MNINHKIYTQIWSQLFREIINQASVKVRDQITNQIYTPLEFQMFIQISVPINNHIINTKEMQ